MITPLKEYPIADQFVAIIGNSQTVKVGGAVTAGATGHSTAVVTGASTTGMLIGVITAILGVKGTVTELNSVTAGAANETTPVYYAQYIPLSVPGLLFSASLDAAAGTTTDSKGFGSFNLSSDSSIFSESSFSLWSSSEKQFFSYGLDETDNTNKTVLGHFGGTLTP